MTTHEFGFDEIERAFAMMQNREDGIIKPLIRKPVEEYLDIMPPPGATSGRW